MEARFTHAALAVAALLLVGAGYRTPNFIVDAPTEELAHEIGEAAEKYRRELAIEWLGKKMPQWAQPCMLTAEVAPHLGAGGATSFVFEHGEVFGWRMSIQGSRERLLDSVLPHEVTHTIFASHFRQALPRWADEGACTTVEHASERAKQQRMLVTFLKTGRGISFSQMFVMKDYPADIMPLYSQGYSLARYLIAQGGKREYLAFLATGLEHENWASAVRQHYGFDNLAVLQSTWLDWVRRGSPEPSSPGPAQAIASLDSKRRQLPSPNLIYRGQSADAPPTSSELVAVSQEAKLAARGAVPKGGWRAAGGAATPRPEPARPDSVYLQSARPQGVEKSRQIILEYDHQAGRGVAPSTSTRRSPLIDASRATGTKWR